METQTFEMTIPVLPPSLIDVLRQQAVLYSYQAPDPPATASASASPQERSTSLGGVPSQIEP